MKITIIGKNKKINDEINNIVNDLNIKDVQILSNDNIKYNIKYTSAIIIDNVLIKDTSILSKDDIKNIIYQFIET